VEALDRTVWRVLFERGFGPAVRQIAEWMNEASKLHTYTPVRLDICSSTTLKMVHT
jgi:hypothetical protein